MTNSKCIKLKSFRLPTDNKPYYDRILTDFALIACEKMGANYLEVGKQDSRGIPSISFYTDSHCIIKQEHFNSNKELLAYCVGYLHALGEF